MNTSASRAITSVRPCVVLALLCACGVEERDRLRSDLSAAVQARDELSRKSAALEAQGKRDRALLLGLRKKAELADALGEKVEELKKRGEEQKKKDELVTAHRDELKEWIEKDLLPAAEARDPDLVNLKDTTSEMAADVEKIRGLKFKHPFMRRRLAREEMGAWMLRDARKEMPPEKAKKEVDVMSAFGLCRPATDFAALFSQLAEAGVAGFYKPETCTFYLVAGNDGRGARPIVFHELVHALDDQYFDLTALGDAVKEDSDREIALKGLIEGCAAYHQGIYEAEHPDDHKAMLKAQATPELMAKQLKMMDEVPPALVAVMALYPYNNAKDWVASMKPDAHAIERLFNDPPVSTEQVLHPEKFPLDGPRDYPHKVATPDVASVLGDGFENVDDNDMGELMIGMLLTQLSQGGKYAPTLINSIDMKTGGLGFRGAAKTASQGWDGDRYTAWMEKSSGKATIVWVTVWDSETDAREFYEAYGDLLGKRVLGKEWSSRPTPLRHVVDGRTSGLDMSGTRVVAVIDAPSDKAEKLFAAGAAATVTADPRDANDK